jgi:hypothetical protein
MTSLDDFSAFAALRREGLHPKLRELFERTIAVPFSEVAVRPDGMLQAGPNPRSKSQDKAISSLRETCAETVEMERGREVVGRSGGAAVARGSSIQAMGHKRRQPTAEN